MEGLTVANGPLKGLWYPAPSHSSWGNKLVTGDYESQSVEFVASHAAADRVMLDIGAHIGIYASAWARNGGTVIACEMFLDHCDLIRRTVEQNGLRGVSIRNLAVLDHCGRASARVNRTSMSHSAMSVVDGYQISGCFVDHVCAGSEMLDVECTTVDALALDRLDLMKVDVEGAELAVLSGARATLERHHPMLVVEIHSIERGMRVARALQDLYGEPANVEMTATGAAQAIWV